MVIVTWIRNDAREWCALETLKLSNITCRGVYLVWYEGTPGRVVCVGRGDIASELDHARRDESVTRFKSHGRLLVTWASVSPSRIDGVARYLAETWPPLTGGGADPDAAAIEVNSPAWLRAFV